MGQQERQHRRSSLACRSLSDGLKVSPVSLAAVLHLKAILRKPAEDVIDELWALVGFGFQELVEPPPEFAIALASGHEFVL